ncbi:MAG: Bax inhibitor-1/YccA family protein [Cyanobacteria bacterium]|nr:Bax inhibitor-1/YccA family protein [Cyanobacteriota bacterium]
MEEKRGYKTGNPALNTKTFEKFKEENNIDGRLTTGERMTLQGTVTKCYMLLATTVACGAITWYYAFVAHNTELIFPWTLFAAAAGFILSLIIIFNQRLAPTLALFYAAFEGLFLGGISAHYESSYPGIVMQSVGLTAGVFFALLMAYTSRLIKPTENFKLGVVAATGGIAIFYILSLLAMAIFHFQIPMLHEGTPIGIAFSVFVVIVAALNLVLDFDFIEAGTESGAPKYMEWYAAFGLLVTLIWLYLEMLRLLSKLRSR